MPNSRFGYSVNIDCIQYLNIIRVTYYSYSYSVKILIPNIIRIRIRSKKQYSLTSDLTLTRKNRTKIVSFLGLFLRWNNENKKEQSYALWYSWLSIWAVLVKLFSNLKILKMSSLCNEIQITIWIYALCFKLSVSDVHAGWIWIKSKFGQIRFQTNLNAIRNNFGQIETK